MTLLNNPICCHKLTGLTPKQVCILSEKISQLQIPWKFPAVGKTLLLLLWLRQYPVDAFTEWIFGISEGSFVKYRWQIVFQLCCQYTDTFTFPQKEERQKYSVKFRNKTVVMVVDGTEQQCIAHVDRNISRTTRSGKKKLNTITKLAGINPRTGKLMYFVRSYRGAESDITLCKLPQNIPCELELDEAVLFDKGFVGIEETWHHCECIYPVKRRHGQEQVRFNHKQFNDEVKTYRIIVENYFAQLKKFKILKFPFRCKGEIAEILAKHHQVWVVCAGIMDEFIHPNGFRVD